MRKKRLVEMVNYSANTLYDIKCSLIEYIKDRGGEWIDHGTDDRDRICFRYRCKIIGLSTHSWDIDGQLVTFPKFLAAITEI